MGVSPIINIYHSDRHSRLGVGNRPTFTYLAEVATALQDIYSRYPVQPYWRNCGRNSIDAEAQAGLFGTRFHRSSVTQNELWTLVGTLQSSSPLALCKDWRPSKTRLQELIGMPLRCVPRK